ncbi:PAS domain S-box protein [Zoogloea sp.]|uniref:PAS domain S-box protein n=1 Tax=Zoogloea sp. TaxID=49181 RepID=UPI0035B4901C
MPPFVPVPSFLRSVRSPLSLGLGGIALVMLVATMLYFGQLIAEQAVRNATQGLQGSAAMAADLLAVGLQERRREVVLLSSSPVLQQGDLAAPAMRALLEKHQALRSDFVWIGLADPDGKVLQATGQLLVGENVSGRPWFKAGLAGPFVGDVHDAVLLARHLARPGDAEPLRFIDVAAPIHDGKGQLKGVLAAHVPWGWVTATVEKAIARTDVTRPEVLIASAQGVALYPYGRLGAVIVPAGLQGAQGVFDEVIDGVRYLTAVVPVPGEDNGLGWHIVLRERFDDAMGELRALRQRMLLIGLAVVVVFVLLAYQFAVQVASRTGELEASRGGFQLLAENASDVVFKASHDGVLEWISPSVTGQLGWAPEEMVGKPFADFVSPDDRAAVLDFREGLQPGRSGVFEARLRKRDGSYCWVSVRINPVGDADGQLHACVGGWRNIDSERRYRAEWLNAQEVAEQAMQLTQESEQRFRTIFDEAPVGIALIDSRSGRIQEVNPKFAAIAGRTRDEMLRVDWMAITHPDDLPEDLANMARLNVGEISFFEMDKRYLRPDGSPVWIRMKVAPVQVAPGERPRHLCMVEDITERKQAEKRQQQIQKHLRDAQKIANLGSWTWDVASGANEWSNELFRLFGYEPGEVEASYDHFFELVVPEDHAKVKAAIAETLAGRATYRVECRINRKDGTQRTILSQGEVQRDAAGVPVSMTGTVLDMTEQKLVEQALVMAKHAAEDASRAKGEFLAFISHELRTPMNAVLGMSLLLEQTALDDEQRATLGKIQIAGRTLLTIINDTLDLSKIEAGELALENRPFSLPALLEELRSVFAVQAVDKGLAFDVVPLPEGIPPVVLGDETRLRQVLMNLLSNAIKFTARGQVRMSLQAVEGTPRLLRCEVADSGIGIRREAIDSLFAPFTQAEASTTRRFGGTGLGLSIVRKLAELMGGRVGVSSELGQGSVFWVEIPLIAADPAALPQAEARLDLKGFQWLSGVRALVVDDSEMNLDVAFNILSRQGAEVSLCMNGQQALDWLAMHAGAVDIVLMDMQMPVMDGFTATRRIREDSRLSQIPIVAFTAGALASQKEQALAAGASAFLTKPVDPQQLIATLRAELERRRGVPPEARPLARGGGEPSGGWPEIAGLDTAAARHRLGDDVELYVSMVDRFLGEFTEAPADGAVPAGEALAKRMHKLVGNAGLIGAVDIARRAAQVESLAQAGDAAGLAPAWQALSAALAGLREAAGPVIAARQDAAARALELASQAAGPVDRRQIDTLCALLEAQDFEAGACFDALAPALRAHIGATLFDELAGCMARLDFRGGHQLLKPYGTGETDLPT